MKASLASSGKKKKQKKPQHYTQKVFFKELEYLLLLLIQEAGDVLSLMVSLKACKEYLGQVFQCNVLRGAQDELKNKCSLLFQKAT